jgi:F-type H+-transporting ATPase subunit gamma
MSHLAHLKRRIRSIKTTKKLTHAMRLISMSLYSKLDKERIATEHHQQAYVSLFKSLRARCPQWKSDVFFPEDVLNSHPLFIIISSTKGFCGGLNNMLFRYTEQKLFVEEHQKATFITVGKKAIDFVEKHDLGPIAATYADLNSNNFADIAHSIIKFITAAQPHHSSVTVYSTFFKNFFAQKPSKTDLIPLVSPEEPETQEASQEATPETPDEFLLIEPVWEQDKIETVSYAAQRTIETIMTYILYQALISEYAARFVAMDGATTNAENYLETLTLQFNKLRQALITREVSELSANL